MARLLIVPSFKGILEANATELQDFFLLREESAVPVEQFVITSDGRESMFPVEPGRYKTALFLLYCAVLAGKPNYAFGRPMQRFTSIYFGYPIVIAACQPQTKHLTLGLLLGDEVKVRLDLKPGYELPDCTGRTVHELIPFGWSQHDELDQNTPVPLIRAALHCFLQAVATRTIPIFDSNDPNCWPSTVWVERAKLLRDRLGSSLAVSP